MNDTEKLAELDSKLAQLKNSLADRVQKLTQRASAPPDALDEGIVPAIKQGEVAVRDALQRYPIATITGAVAAGAAGTVLAYRYKDEPRVVEYLRKYRPYVSVAGDALRSLGVAVAAGFLEGAIRVVEKKGSRRYDDEAIILASVTVLSSDEPPMEMTSAVVGRPM